MREKHYFVVTTDASPRQNEVATDRPENRIALPYLSKHARYEDAVEEASNADEFAVVAAYTNDD